MSRMQEQGFTLVEALVALVVLSVGMLGMAGLYVITMQSGGTAIYRTQAVNLAADMADRIRANRTAGVAYGDTTPSDHNCTGATSAACTPTDLADDDLDDWETRVAATLPSGVGTVTVVAGTPNSYQITVKWNETNQTAQLQYVLNTQI
ncbi:MAG TPA: type IV pilus modification protein PilV [Steroidobacteraceae bacterium]|nr:type IV pilus modification protein PilV [Steroidobacteraceae bacterium]